MSASMKILSLNYRGLGIPEAVQELRCLISEEDPKLLFLFETKLDSDGFRRLKRKIDFQQGFEVSRVGLGGGLACTKLFEKKVLHSFSCVLCNEEAETYDHLFLKYSFAQAVWLQTSLLNDYRFYPQIKFIDVMNAALKKLSASVFDTLCIACWRIWKCRNRAVFNNIALSYHELWARADLYRLESVEMQQVNLQENNLKAVR